MGAVRSSWLKRAEYFLFPAFPDAEMAPLQLRVTTIAFYSIVIASLVALPPNLARDLAARSYIIVTTEILYLVFITLGVFLLWFKQRLRAVRLAFGIAVMILVGGQLVSGGGTRGLGYFYIIAGYSVLYYILGFKGGLAVPVIILVGTVIRIKVGGFSQYSLFTDPETSISFLLVVVVATVLGIFSVVYQQLVVGSLYKAAYTDELTGLANRRRLELAIESRIRRYHLQGRGFSLIGLKLMHFSRVNSYQGSHFADGILAAVGTRLRAAIGSDDLLSRFTGTVFLVMTELTDHTDLEEAGKRLIDAAQKPLQHEGRTLVLEASVSVTRFPGDGFDQEILVSNIMAGFSGLREHTGLVCFYDEARHKAEAERYTMGEELRQAVARGEFRIVYHPKRKLSDARFSGAEVLLRWHNQRFGEVPPDVFIPLAEESECILEISRWVVAAAFSDLRTLQSSGKTMVHAINLSIKDLADPSFIGFLEELFKTNPVDRAMVEFEVTEGVMMDANPVIQQTIEYIRHSGCRLAIDDFGTGYSSLSYLHRLNAHNLKIDKSFIMPLNESSPESPVVDAIISMASSLGLDITAEGIETPFQEAYLRERRCTYGQGWLYARPLPLAEYLKLLDNHSPLLHLFPRA